MNNLLGGFTIIFITIVGFKYLNKKKCTVESFVPEDGIRIIDIVDEYGHDISKENLRNYLEHHINKTDIEFDKQVFNHPVYVRFKHLNEIYQICLNGLNSTKNDHRDIKTTPKYLSAILRHNDKEICVTQNLREFHGNTRNFFNHIPDVENDLGTILKICGELCTFDMMGVEKTTIIG